MKFHTCDSHKNITTTGIVEKKHLQISNDVCGWDMSGMARAWVTDKNQHSQWQNVKMEATIIVEKMVVKTTTFVVMACSHIFPVEISCPSNYFRYFAKHLSTILYTRYVPTRYAGR